MIEAQVVDPEKDLPRVWDAVKDDVRRGFKRGHGDTTNETNFLNDLVNRETQMLAFLDGDKIVGCMTFSISQRDTGPVPFIGMVTAKPLNDEIIDVAVAAVKTIASNVGAKRVETIARPGVVAAWKTRGWKSKAVIMTMET